MMTKEKIDWSEIGDMVCEILTVSLKGRRNLERDAKKMDATFEGFVAAAITQRVSEEVERLSKPKKAKAKSSSKESAKRTEIDQFRWMQGTFAAAYVLDTVGMLNPATKARLDSLEFPGVARWDQAVEQDFGINRTFVRSVYALCTEIKGPVDGVVFVLQGIGCPDVEERLTELLE